MSHAFASQIDGKWYVVEAGKVATRGHYTSLQAWEAYDRTKETRVKVFCWLPTPVYTSRYYQNGCRWLSYGWLDKDGNLYETKDS